MPSASGSGWEPKQPVPLQFQTVPRKVCFECLKSYADHPGIICQHDDTAAPCNNCKAKGLGFCFKVTVNASSPVSEHIVRLQTIAGKVAHLQATDRLPTPEMMQHLQDQQEAVIQLSTMWTQLRYHLDRARNEKSLAQVPANSGMLSFQPAATGPPAIKTSVQELSQAESTVEASRLLDSYKAPYASDQKYQVLEASLQKANAEVDTLRRTLEQVNIKANLQQSKPRADQAKLSQERAIIEKQRKEQNEIFARMDEAWEKLERRIGVRLGVPLPVRQIEPARNTVVPFSRGSPFARLPRQVKTKIFRYFLQSLPSIATRLSGRPGCPVIPDSADGKTQVVLRKLGPILSENERVIVGNLLSLVGNRVVLAHLQPFINAADTRAIRDLCLVSKDFRARCMFIQSKFTYLSYVVTLKIPRSRVWRTAAPVAKRRRRRDDSDSPGPQIRKRPRSDTHQDATIHCATASS